MTQIGSTVMIMNQDQMIRSKKSNITVVQGSVLYSNTALSSITYSVLFYETFIIIVTTPYKGHTRQSPASSPLPAVVTASFVRHFSSAGFFSSSLSLSSLLLPLFSLSLSLSTSSQLQLQPLQSLHSTCYTTCSPPVSPYSSYLVTCSTAARRFP